MIFAKNCIMRNSYQWVLHSQFPLVQILLHYNSTITNFIPGALKFVLVEFVLVETVLVGDPLYYHIYLRLNFNCCFIHQNARSSREDSMKVRHTYIYISTLKVIFTAIGAVLFLLSFIKSCLIISNNFNKRSRYLRSTYVECLHCCKTC